MKPAEEYIPFVPEHIHIMDINFTEMSVFYLFEMKPGVDVHMDCFCVYELPVGSQQLWNLMDR